MCANRPSLKKCSRLALVGLASCSATLSWASPSGETNGTAVLPLPLRVNATTRMSSPAWPSPGLTLHVAPRGSDAGNGSEKTPFASLELARDEIRARRKNGSLPGAAVNFVNERFITSGDWKGNRFITSFTAYLNNTDGNYYFDTTAGVESVMKVIAIDTTYKWGEIVNVLDDWYQFNEAGTGWLDNQYSGATQIIRIGNKNNFSFFINFC